MKKLCNLDLKYAKIMKCQGRNALNKCKKYGSNSPYLNDVWKMLYK